MCCYQLSQQTANKQTKKPTTLFALIIHCQDLKATDFSCAATFNFPVSEITKTRENNQYVLANNCTVLLFPLYHNNQQETSSF